jgi:hypothetical protein
MSNGIGTIAWVDLTVSNAEEVRNFYKKVVGWRSEEVDCGDHVDYNMIPPDSATPVAGICHALQHYENMPPAWMVYISVADIEQSVKTCLALGGEVILDMTARDNGKTCFIKDPAGAYVALYQE